MWKRLMDHKGVPKGCGICEFMTVEGMLKCLRLLKGLKIEEDYELSVNFDPKTELYMRYWRESKKYEWIEAKHRAGLEVDMKEIERKESNGECGILCCRLLGNILHCSTAPLYKRHKTKPA